ncbi:MAG TPA: hypothetical protein VNL98_00190, partial [Gemmatimonadales bacterium]|nr:hypothetical protein [Gemmatimonadales bacterium]
TGACPPVVEVSVAVGGQTAPAILSQGSVRIPCAVPGKESVTMSRLHLVAVWNPIFGPNVMEMHLETLLDFVRRFRAGQVEEDDVYVWWGKLRSPHRRRPLAHLDQILALDTEIARDDPGPETHLFLTDYRTLYVAHVGEVTSDDVTQLDYAHVPEYYRTNRLPADCWFRLWDVRRLVSDDTASVARELSKLRNTRYHDQPVSIYGGMVELPLLVTDPLAPRYFDEQVRNQSTDGRFWVEFDAERAGIGAMERELRQNLLGDDVWAGLEPTARSFIASAEKMYRDNLAEPAFDFAGVIIEFAKALEVQCNAVLRRALRDAPPGARGFNLDGRTVDVGDAPWLNLGQLHRLIGEEREINRYLRRRLVNGEWFTASLPAVLSELAGLRNPAAHRRRVRREEATAWRNQLLGVGCMGHLVQLGRTRPA